MIKKCIYGYFKLQENHQFTFKYTNIIYKCFFYSSLFTSDFKWIASIYSSLSKASSLTRQNNSKSFPSLLNLTSFFEIGKHFNLCLLCSKHHGFGLCRPKIVPIRRNTPSLTLSQIVISWSIIRSSCSHSHGAHYSRVCFSFQFMVMDVVKGCFLFEPLGVSRDNKAAS